MEHIDNQIERKMGYWTTLGLVPLLLSFFLFLVKSPVDNLFLPLIASVGMILCLSWRSQGVNAAVALILGATLYQYVYGAYDERLWQLGVGCSFALALLIAALCHQEKTALVDLPTESLEASNTQLKQLQDEIVKNNAHHSINEALTSKNKELELAQQELESANLQLQKEHGLVSDQLQVLDQTAKELQKHLNQVMTNAEQKAQKQQQLLEEALEAKNSAELTLARLEKECSQLQKEAKLSAEQLTGHVETERRLNQKNQVLESTTADLRTKYVEQQEQFKLITNERITLQNQLNQLSSTHEQVNSQWKQSQQLAEEQKQQFNSQLKHAQEVAEEQKQTTQAAANQSLQLQQQLHTLKTESASLKSDLDAFRTSYTTLKATAEPLQQELQTVQQAHQIDQQQLIQLDRALRRENGLLKQLREQFQEKSSALNEARFRLFHAEEELVCVNREQKESSLYARSEESRGFERHVTILEKHYIAVCQQQNKEIEHLESLISNLLSERRV
ncbi:MAG: hypothetical protein H0X51_07675 [Parachlamydiaceae bacterium]|nr:hypothetical protein [Parachlamydiaceae bacterium]